jgi:hypothetical protein
MVIRMALGTQINRLLGSWGAAGAVARNGFFYAMYRFADSPGPRDFYRFRVATRAFGKTVTGTRAIGAAGVASLATGVIVTAATEGALYAGARILAASNCAK